MRHCKIYTGKYGGMSIFLLMKIEFNERFRVTFHLESEIRIPNPGLRYWAGDYASYETTSYTQLNPCGIILRCEIMLSESGTRFSRDTMCSNIGTLRDRVTVPDRRSRSTRFLDYTTAGLLFNNRSR
jgi:hypothetical protein